MKTRFAFLRELKKVLWIVGFAIGAGSSYAETTPEDPWEGYNRTMSSFNDTLDKYALKPLAEGYDYVTPSPVQRGVSNFFNNLGEVGNIANNLFQAKWDATAASTFRFLINSTAGFLGIFDVASEMGLERQPEDFGQTLGYWGVGSGPYLVLPLLGPSTVRDATGTAVDYFNYDPIELLDPTTDEYWSIKALGIVQIRAKLLSSERLIFGDRYTFIRDVYLQTRQAAVLDGQVERPTTEEANEEDGSWGDEADDSWGDEDSWGGEDSWGDEGETY
ncbi:MlaA family lipoprotein [Marinomonas balearica]|uniref:Phospholipid-binding lipoprotein MlaA n=1 Tax=Marinomonas balearica TaxID=491947 RepID=A0A4V3CH18_9GAMM|nr:VacJ family lipoprotein [Marinomonas balearica]TDO99912.1 phospholipid-binding lipoprotein MlaA [Marinomonas balearica]